MRTVLFMILLAGLASSFRTSTDPATFPDAWVGTWSGAVEVHTPGGARPGFTVELTIEETEDPERFTWTTRFEGDAGSQERNYELIVRDPERGAFAVDEKNGIVLEAQLLGGVLVSWFTIGGSHLVTRQELVDAGTEDERILYEILAATDGAAVKTGEEDAVTCYPLSAVQRGELRRK